MAKGTSEEVTAALEAAVAGETSKAESSTATEEVETTEKTAEEQNTTVPYSRFKEVIDARNESDAKTTKLEEQLAENNTSLNKLTAMLEEREADSNTLTEIRELAQDPKMRDHVVALDKALKGIEDEIEEGETTPEKTQDRTRELLKETKEELEDVVADQQADLLLSRADIIADKLLDGLPKEYLPEDKDVVSRLWVDEMDWEKAAGDSDNLSTHLTESFQKALDIFGKPRGAMLSLDDVEIVKEGEEATSTPAPEEELAEILGKNWAATKTVKSSTGVETTVPELTDDEFTESMAKAMRIARGSG